MRSMSFLRAAAVSAALAIGASGVLIASADPVADRQAMMKAIGQQMGAAKALSTAETFDAAKAKAAMSTVAADAKKLTTLFPSASAPGNSEAKVWEANADFMKRMNDFAALATKASAATTFDAYGPAFKEVSATCKSCHDIYRKKK